MPSIPWGVVKEQIEPRLLTASLAVSIAVAAVIVAGGGGAFAGSGQSSPPAEGMSPAPSSAVAMAGDPVTIEQAVLIPEVTLTSERFRPRVALVMQPIAGMHGERTDWCPDVYTSERMLVLRWLYSCRPELRLIRPFAVDCGTPDEHPDAAELAAAILAKPGRTRVRDMGDLTAFAEEAPGFDLSGHTGRTLLITRPGRSQGSSDQDRCSLLPDPDTGDPIVEIGSAEGLLMLMDIDGELVVLQISGGDADLAEAMLHSFLAFDFTE